MFNVNKRVQGELFWNFQCFKLLDRFGGVIRWQLFHFTLRPVFLLRYCIISSAVYSDLGVPTRAVSSKNMCVRNSFILSSNPTMCCIVRTKGGFHRQLPWWVPLDERVRRPLLVIILASSLIKIQGIIPFVLKSLFGKLVIRWFGFISSSKILWTQRPTGFNVWDMMKFYMTKDSKTFNIVRRDFPLNWWSRQVSIGDCCDCISNFHCFPTKNSSNAKVW